MADILPEPGTRPSTAGVGRTVLAWPRAVRRRRAGGGEEMATHVARHDERAGVGGVIRHLHGLVTYGPGDLDIAEAMSAQGYDAVKWGEGQGMLAELVSCDLPGETCLAAAVKWYNEAATVARRALVARPRLLAKLGVAEV